MADAADLNSAARKGVRVRIPAPAPRAVVDAEDIYRLEQALPARYQARASYMASGTIINILYRLVGGGSTEPPLVSEDRTRLLGKSLVIDSEMATVTTTGTKFLLYGDFSRFVIVDRIGLQVELIPHLVGTNPRPTGQRGLYSFWRNSSKVIDANAFRVLIGIA
jgi:HK97 family phage major capsid protein